MTSETPDALSISPELEEILARRRKLPSNLREGQLVRSNRAEIAKKEVLVYLRQGKTIEESMNAVGRTRVTFYNWCRSPKFKAASDEARAAFDRDLSRHEMTISERADQFEPIMRSNYRTWAEYIVAFRKAYFGFDTFDHQWRILEAWEAAPPGGISVVLVSPEAGKTTLLADTVVADLCSDPNMRRALVGEGQDKASKLMSRIQKRLSTDNAINSLLYSHFGPFEPPRSDRTKKWNSVEFTLATSNHDEQDPSVTSVGMGSNIRGARWDAVDLDDIQSLKTQSQTQRFLDIFRGDIVTRPGKSGRIRITGSRVCRGDFYEELERLDLIDELVVIPALDTSKPVGSQSYFPAVYDEAGNRVTNDRGDPLGWTDDDLAQRRKKVGEDMWSRVYMMRPQSDYSSMITEGDIVNATDMHRVPGQPAVNSVATICGLDPSLANHAAFVACGYDAEHLYVLDVRDVLRPGTNQALHAEIRRWTERFRPDTWVIENNTLQRGYLTDDSFLALRSQYGFQSVGHHSGDNKTDVQLGVPAMMEAIVNGQIRFPNIRAEHEAFAMLYDQLMSWRVDIPTRRLTQDLVMALWFCYLRWRNLRQLVEADPSGWRRSGIDEITMYAYARTNISIEGQAERQRTPMSYDQQWDALRESA